MYSDLTGKLVELNLHAPWEEVKKQQRSENNNTDAETTPASNSAKERGRGRPRLGVVGCEVTLLPRHWEWLNAQPGGASVTLRRLVEDAKKRNSSADSLRDRKEIIYQFMLRTGGNLPHFEEATRILFSKGTFDDISFGKQIDEWPQDLRTYLLKLIQPLVEEKSMLKERP
ncbi:MAG: DUF2239 family protein [Verrucomicrobiales bacterium]